MSIQYSKICLGRKSCARVLGVSILIIVPLVSAAALAQSESVIFSFANGIGPVDRPLQDSTGAFLIPTYYGGQGGTLTKISENHGVWKGRTIFNFVRKTGENPDAGVIEDPNGVIYGTTQRGGTYGAGTVFSLTPNNGNWTETVLHNFSGGSDGERPNVNLVRDKASGTLYGTTPSGGGNADCGTAFALVPSGSNWTFTLLHNFAGGSDGCAPDAPIHGVSQKGIYFSTTFSGGLSNAGTVYELAEKNGLWTESVVYSFGLGEGSPVDLDVDPDTGNMYGVTASGHGVVFELAKSGHNWTQSVLYSFRGDADGDVPIGLHLEKTTGTLFGTTEFGGAYNRGTLFELINTTGYSWAETVLHDFGSSQGDGTYPKSRPVEDPNTGTLYGVTGNGGLYSGGTLYSVVP